MKTITFVLYFLFSISAIAGWGEETKFYGDINIYSTYFHADSSVPESLPPLPGITDWLVESAALDANLSVHSDSSSFFTHDKLYLDTDGVVAATVYEAYVSANPFAGFNFIAGIKHLTWGTGLVFSPSDKLNKELPLYYSNGTSLFASALDLFDSSKQQNGFPGFVLTMSPTSTITLAGAISLEHAIIHIDSSFWQRLTYALYISMFFDNIEIFLSTVYGADANLRPGAGLTFELADFVFNLEAALELDSHIRYPVASVSSPSGVAWLAPVSGRPFFLGDAGVKKTIALENGSLLFVVEYLYSDTGYSSSEESLYYGALEYELASGSGEAFGIVPEYLSKQYLFATIGFELTDLLSISESAIMNLSDQSLLLATELASTGFGSLDISFRLYTALGPAASEFRKLPQTLRLDAGAVYHF